MSNNFSIADGSGGVINYSTDESTGDVTISRVRSDSSVDFTISGSVAQLNRIARVIQTANLNIGNTGTITE